MLCTFEVDEVSIRDTWVTTVVVDLLVIPGGDFVMIICIAFSGRCLSAHSSGMNVHWAVSAFVLGSSLS